LNNITSQPLVELKNVSKAFGPKVILENANLEIHAGEAVGVIGPSGTGKSTILRLIAGLIAPDSGEVYIRGQKRLGTINQGEDTLGVSVVFQDSALFDSLTVEENISFVLSRQKQLSFSEIEKLVEKALVKIGLPGIGKRYPAELSGGMRKRVGAARAIFANMYRDKTDHTQKIVMYDEPTAGLDPIASTRLENLMRDFLGIEEVCDAYLVVTHQDSTIRRATDRIVFVYDGKIQWDGPTKEAYQSEHPLLKQFFHGNVEGPII